VYVCSLPAAEGAEDIGGGPAPADLQLQDSCECPGPGDGESCLTTVRANHFLTQTFRFGLEIALLANSCLRGLMLSDSPDNSGWQ
jgi:hypothetical protein